MRKELASTQTLISQTFTHQVPSAGLLLNILMMMSSNMFLTWGSSVMSSHPDVITFTLSLMNAVTKQSTTCRKISHKLSAHKDIPQCHDIRDFWNCIYHALSMPVDNTCALSAKNPESLHITPNLVKYSFMYVANAISTSIYTCRCCSVDSLFLQHYCNHDRSHYEWCHIKSKF